MTWPTPICLRSAKSRKLPKAREPESPRTRVTRSASTHLAAERRAAVTAASALATSGLCEQLTCCRTSEANVSAPHSHCPRSQRGPQHRLTNRRSAARSASLDTAKAHNGHGVALLRVRGSVPWAQGLNLDAPVTTASAIEQLRQAPVLIERGPLRPSRGDDGGQAARADGRATPIYPTASRRRSEVVEHRAVRPQRAQQFHSPKRASTALTAGSDETERARWSRQTASGRTWCARLL